MASKKILIADKISQTAINLINKEEDFIAEVKTDLSEEELVKIIPEYDAIIVRSATKVTQKIIENAENLKIIGRAGVGYDNIDINAAAKRNIAVMNAPFGNINSAAEHTVAMMLALARHIPNANNSLKQKKWEKKKFTGVELKSKTLGIIGFGKVGRIVAKICSGFDMNIIAYDPFVDAEIMEDLKVKKADFNELLEKADFITLHLCLNEKTKNIIDKPQFEIMKQGARIINVARGGLINEKALFDAVVSKKISGAAIDTWIGEPDVKSPLLELDEVIGTPHLGASTIEAQENVGIDIANQIINGLKNNNLINVVNGVEKLRNA